MWTYYCADEKLTLSGETKRQLASRLLQHARTEHKMEITYQQALEWVKQGAKRV